MAELKIIATIVVKAEQEKEVLVALQNVVNATRKEEGISHTIYIKTLPIH